MDDWKLQVDGGLDDGLEDGGYDDMDGPDMGPEDEGAAIRARYGVPQPARGAGAGMGWDESAAAELERLSRQNEQLVDRIAGKDVEIERLEQTLLAVQAPPGIDVGRMLDAAGGDAGADVRDAKIVDLAKRNRELARTVGKAKRAIADARRRAAEAEARAAAAEDEAASSAAAGAAAAGPAGQHGGSRTGSPAGGAEEELRRAQAQAKAARARIEGLQHRLDAAQAEAKAARRALAAEVGPGEELEAVLAAAGLASAAAAPGGSGRGDDGESVATGASGAGAGSPAKRRLGWRGRAQRIIKLKAKLAELQRNGVSQAGPGGGVSRPRAGQAPAAGVDDQARAVIGAMEGQRQRAAEELSEALEAEQASHADTQRRLDAARARVSSLQREAAQLREGARTLVDKSDVDDKLVAALRAERVSLQQQLSQGQARRLDAQEKLIRDLRAQLREAKAAAGAALPPGVPGRATNGVAAPASRAGLPRPESAASSSAAAGSGGDAGGSSGGRPGSASVRALASLEVRVAAAEEAAAVEREAAAALRESRDRAEERCRLLERQADQYVAKFSAMERRCRELEARVGAAPPVTDAVSLAAQLATSENERRALRGNSASAIAARDAEVARLREQCDALLARHRRGDAPADGGKRSTKEHERD
ncbi:hypothetical protein FNF29_07788 [Cafeteria roenbergensis]|uniref:Uncharacterized protein n=1 Tax=Cafeteria roenbergensis TaxID=33653 RepID=A0A5A8C170_CAFRO|nr:hypothetical protein FNF29_07788 [Cafeteria roenbergensis]|eukprot:KAA0146812.1 hypothetical protein FNF29_07788 [Cafeteria roenbergensis]